MLLLVTTDVLDSGGCERNLQQAPAYHLALQLQACMPLVKV